MPNLLWNLVCSYAYWSIGELRLPIDLLVHDCHLSLFVFQVCYGRRWSSTEVWAYLDVLEVMVRTFSDLNHSASYGLLQSSYVSETFLQLLFVGYCMQPLICSHAVPQRCGVPTQPKGAMELCARTDKVGVLQPCMLVATSPSAIQYTFICIC